MQIKIEKGLIFLMLLISKVISISEVKFLLSHHGNKLFKSTLKSKINNKKPKISKNENKN